MADFPPFAFTTQESWYGELSFKAAEDGSAVSLAGRQFEMHITPAASGAQLVPPVLVLTMEEGRGLSLKQGDPSTLVFRVPKTTANGFPRGEFTGDVLEVLNGERYLFMPVRIAYAEPSALRAYLSRFLGVSVSFASRQQPIYTPLAVPGREGRPGATIITSTVPPVPADGKDGDFFIEDRTATGRGRRMYGPKIGGAWPGTPWTIQVAAYADVPGLSDAIAASAQRAANGSDFPDKAALRQNIGLGSVNNTADAEKPISVAQGMAIAARLAASANLADLSDVGAALESLGLVEALDVLAARKRGIKGDDGTDDSDALIAYADYCRLANRAFKLPKSRPRYRLTKTLNLRDLYVDAPESTFRIDHDGVGIILGGTATIGNNPNQTIGSLIRQTGRSTALPDVQVIGYKNGTITIKSVPFFQIYANASVSKDGSSGYANYYINSVTKLHLESAGGGQGWINENQFYLNRVLGEVVIRGEYRHNHNKFYNGTFEGTNLIDIDNGGDNKFFGPRFEGGPTTIKFGINSERNIIYRSWVAAAQGGPYSLYDNGTVIDLGRHNKVLNENALYNDCTVVASADISEPTVNNRVAVGVGLRSRATQLQRIAGVGTNSEIVTTDYLPVAVGDWYFWLWELSNAGDNPLYRPGFEFVDANLVPIAAASNFIETGGTWTATGAYLRPGVNTASGRFAVVTKAAIEAGAAFMRVHVLGSASTASGAVARRITILNFSTNRVDRAVAVCRDKNTQPGKTLVSAVPTQGFVPLGFEAHKSDGTAIYRCIKSLETATASAAASGDGVITVASAAGIAAGDIIGINLDNRDTHWTTVSGAPSGSSVSLAVALPAAATAAARVVVVRWATIAQTLT